MKYHQMVAYRSNDWMHRSYMQIDQGSHLRGMWADLTNTMRLSYFDKNIVI